MITAINEWLKKYLWEKNAKTADDGGGNRRSMNEPEDGAVERMLKALDSNGRNGFDK